MLSITYRFKSKQPLSKISIKNFDAKVKALTKNNYTIFVNNNILLVSVPFYLLDNGITKMHIAGKLLDFAADDGLAIELQN